MSEQATRIADHASGDYIATRDANETDAASNARVIQEFIACGSPVAPSTVRGSAASVSSDDTSDLDSLPADLTGNLITVGDKKTLIVDVIHDADDGEADITPIVFNSAGDTALAVLETKTCDLGALDFQNAANDYVAQRQTWDVAGAHKIGIHISGIGGTSNGVVVKATVN